ncbi:MAG TPA: endonuclease/exonuclease/phosphatase family protein [Gemmatimonadales bacterium]|jgi:endonuclease/exonuclease/phosphatase family metal-dependent hydrolase|nr:endonuclease/exonuclease/phosphatase family protein [Gemmatimonadales bacterium]
MPLFSRRALPLLASALALACSGAETLAPSDPAVSSRSANGARSITVMSRNIYIGANVDAVILALISPDPNDDLPALLGNIAVLQQTAYPVRAQALAAEIERARPHIVGLQEVTELQVNLTGLGIPVDINLDFLPILLDALAARGLSYTVAAQVTNLTAAPLPGVGVTDHDVILVDASRVSVGPGIVARTYALNLGVVAPGVDLKRGWVRIEADVEGIPVTVASTHLESGSFPGFAALRAGQAAELIGSLAAESPAIVLGDLNDVPGSAMYGVVTGAGFSDAWAALRPGASGFTCCHLADLSDQVARFDQRIDYVFARGLGGPQGRLQGRVSLIGDQPGERVAGPLHPIWASDHAGVVMELLVTPAVALAGAH